MSTIHFKETANSAHEQFVAALTLTVSLPPFH
jgi:hypothetical protein